MSNLWNANGIHRHLGFRDSCKKNYTDTNLYIKNNAGRCVGVAVENCVRGEGGGGRDIVERGELERRSGGGQGAPRVRVVKRGSREGGQKCVRPVRDGKKGSCAGDDKKNERSRKDVNEQTHLKRLPEEGKEPALKVLQVRPAIGDGFIRKVSR